MMNALRLRQPIVIDLFETRTALPFSLIEKQIAKAVSLELLIVTEEHFQVTQKDYLFLNVLLEIFL